MTKKFALTGFAAALLLTPAVAMAQHIDVGPGGVRVHGDGHHHHHERRVIERRHHHDDLDHTGSVRVERRHDHHDDHHDDD
jgi:Spy/CpxP family protein refolding chaperone